MFLIYIHNINSGFGNKESIKFDKHYEEHKLKQELNHMFIDNYSQMDSPSVNSYGPSGLPSATLSPSMNNLAFDIQPP